MRSVAVLAVAAIVLFGVAVSEAHAQRGVGDQTGVAREPVKPEIVSLSGKLVEIKTGPCESTTGGAMIGTHIILETAEKAKLNVHLGPAAAVADTVAQLNVGQEVMVNAFRTDKLKDMHYVAKSLIFDNITVNLRDDAMRPVWAQGSGAGRGPGSAQGGGRGRAAGWRRGGPRWRVGR